MRGSPSGRGVEEDRHYRAIGSERGIAPGGVLFWDEPETNLNPKLITQMVDVLIELAKHGVQIVLATHDYLLSHRLSLLAEYDKLPRDTVRFFGLARSEPDGPVSVSRGDTLADLPNNPIVDEFARHYDFERELFDRSQEAEMFEVIESRLRFRFGEPWQRMEQWDKHACYTAGLGMKPTTGAVDFIGLYGSDPYFIEVKNFRDYRIENKNRLTSGALADEVAEKVRDTIAALVWAMDRGSDTESLRSLLAQFFAIKKKCSVVLWLEEDPQTRPADRTVLAETIKRRLHWLKPHVIVLSQEERPLPGLEVSGAPREK
ncbi:AAA family ATPase [Nannocystis pusilla]|uniref:AAA family ATPase n=1 Tax=Nannocystis pusilla TaxID=889268 RepID=UPI003B7615E9